MFVFVNYSKNVIGQVISNWFLFLVHSVILTVTSVSFHSFVLFLKW